MFKKFLSLALAIICVPRGRTPTSATQPGSKTRSAHLRISMRSC